MERFYSGKGAEVGPYLDVIIDKEGASLDIPMDGITLPSGWSLRPLVYPTKASVLLWSEFFNECSFTLLLSPCSCFVRV